MLGGTLEDAVEREGEVATGLRFAANPAFAGVDAGINKEGFFATLPGEEGVVKLLDASAPMDVG